MIVTGDPSQVDLPPGQTSGLAEAVQLLDGVKGIAHATFTSADVIRHELVGRIVEAYDNASARKREKRDRSDDRRDSRELHPLCSIAK